MSSVMEISEILDRIKRVTGKFEREAVEAAIVRQDEITPELLQIHKLLLRFARLPGDLLDSICGNFLDGGFAIALERTVRAEIAISAFGTSFSAAEISISAALKTAGAAPAGLFPIASQPSTNRLAFVLMAEVRPGGQS